MLTYCYRVLNLMFTEFSRFSTGMLMRFALQQFLLIFFRRVTEFIIGLVRSFWPFGSVGVVGFRSADRPFWVGRLFCFGATFVFFIFYLLRYDENENVVWQPFDTFISGICAVSRLTSFLLPSLSFLLSFVTGFNIFFLFCGFHFVCVCVCVCAPASRRCDAVFCFCFCFFFKYRVYRVYRVVCFSATF